ncbi:hypothetical protein FRC05_006005 [Tulasnella sp. 425]|nr:hypothetical protein FRC05_006005 [Tulasnella sp. 425]
MTSHLIESFAKRTNELGGIGNNSAEEPEIARKISRLNRPDDCAFCNVVAGKQPAFRIYEDDHTIAILGKFRVEYAQAVPHVHYHIVPAPLQDYANPPIKPVDESPEKEPAYQNMLRAELLLRNELDDEDGKKLAEMIQAKL